MQESLGGGEEKISNEHLLNFTKGKHPGGCIPELLYKNPGKAFFTSQKNLGLRSAERAKEIE